MRQQTDRVAMRQLNRDLQRVGGRTLPDCRHPLIAEFGSTDRVPNIGFSSCQFGNRHSLNALVGVPSVRRKYLRTLEMCAALPEDFRWPWWEYVHVEIHPR